MKPYGSFGQNVQKENELSDSAPTDIWDTPSTWNRVKIYLLNEKKR